MTAAGWRGDPASRRVIDVAIGILMGLRGCSEQAAFDDLVAAVHDTGVGPGALARALVSEIERADAEVPHRREVVQRWGRLMASPVAAGCRAAD